jgi:hypothetical protein
VLLWWYVADDDPVFECWHFVFMKKKEDNISRQGISA